MCDEQNLKESDYKILVKDQAACDALDLMLQWPEDKSKREKLLQPTNCSEIGF